MKTLSLLSPAKLNLFLHITGRREDGYHLLQTAFQLLDYGDRLTFTLRGDGQLQLNPAIEGLENRDNLIIRAAELLRQQCQCQTGANIALQKILPMGGGIGGGSSNAATTLLALNRLWNAGLDTDTLADLGLKLGADVPVFIRGYSAFAEGIGEQLQVIEIPQVWYLVVKPQCHVSTVEIFSHKQLTRNTPPITIAAFFEQGGHNDCQPVVRKLYPEVDFALNWLQQHAHAQLTGTGACVYAAFADKSSAEQVHSQLPDGLTAFIARGVDTSPTIAALNCQPA